MYFKLRGKDYLASALKDEDITVVMRVDKDEETKFDIFTFIDYFHGRDWNEEELIKMTEKTILDRIFEGVKL